MKYLFFSVILSSLISCAPKPGPDKQFVGTLQGSVTGAVGGAVTGLQVGSGTGPGAFVGAGIGAITGGFRGLMQDRLEEELLRLQVDAAEARGDAFAQRILQEQWRRRKELHPGRDIFPADIFFTSDSVKLSPEGRAVLNEIYTLNKNRLPWSRFGILSYVQASDPNSQYARHLTSRRARAIGDYLIQLGLEPRRVSARSAVIPGPLVLSDKGRGDRYSQAVEFIPRDLPHVPGESNVRPKDIDENEASSFLDTPSKDD